MEHLSEKLFAVIAATPCFFFKVPLDVLPKHWEVKIVHGTEEFPMTENFVQNIETKDFFHKQLQTGNYTI